MRIGLPFLTAVTVFLTAAAPARADFVPVSSALSLEADAQADSGTPATDTQSQSQGATINPLTASVDASVLDEFGTSVEATAKGSATWTSPSAGEVVLSNVGWTASSFQETWSAALNKGLDYSYTFTSPQSGTLTFSYAVTASGADLTGLNGFHYDFDGDHQTFGPNTSGTLTEAIAAGGTYTLHLQNLAATSGGAEIRAAHMTGTFDFSFSPSAASAVPEPSSLTLLAAAAIALAGWHGRRRPSRARSAAE